MSYKVELTYFKNTGKYYESGEYESEKSDLHEIWDEVSAMRESGNLPGLMKGHSRFIVSIHVPGHRHEHPRLII